MMADHDLNEDMEIDSAFDAAVNVLTRLVNSRRIDCTKAEWNRRVLQAGFSCGHKRLRFFAGHVI